ncbi:MAG TPA: hemolysin III family protein [Chloroflexia bacterium]|nr:hemolysin III family protein [Chloroflexia bacterium]
MQQPVGTNPSIDPARPVKPLLRGWSHAGAAVLAAAITVALCWRSRADLPRLISLLIFGLSMVQLYTVSALYHMGSWRPSRARVLGAIDHSDIFVVIAGTYTPLCFNVLAGWARPAALVTIWLLAAAGVALAIVTTRIDKVNRWLNTGLYIGMGWISILLIPAFAAALSWTAVGLMMFGGALNTVGAVIYGRRRPNPFPRVFGFHELFHLCVIAGGAVFAAVIWIWVVPFPRA